jgi:hypothetical protein
VVKTNEAPVGTESFAKHWEAHFPQSLNISVHSVADGRHSSNRPHGSAHSLSNHGFPSWNPGCIMKDRHHGRISSLNRFQKAQPSLEVFPFPAPLFAERSRYRKTNDRLSN